MQIHQYSRMIKASYKKQKNEDQLAHLTLTKQKLTHQLYALQNKSKIKEFAIHKLNLEPIVLNRIKRLELHDNQTI
jgi:hypothetical protein